MRVLAGSLPRKLSFFRLCAGLTGLGTNPPPQFGHTLPWTLSTHAAQNVLEKDAGGGAGAAMSKCGRRRMRG